MSRKKKYIFIVIAWLTLFVLGEIGTRIYFAIAGKISPTTDKSLENEWKWAQRHLKYKKAVLDSEYIFDPKTGWKNKPHMQSEKLQTNSFGMRNNKEFSKQKKTKRILFVGDSYTFGLHVANKEIFSKLLNNFLPQWEVLNMAVPGTGTDQQIITFEQFGKEYQADIVILGFFVRDYSRNIVSFRDYAKPLFVLKNGSLQLTHSPVISPTQLHSSYVTGQRTLGNFYGSYLLNSILRGIYKHKRRHRVSQVSPGWLLLSKLMERFFTRVEKAGAIPIWLIIPSRDTMQSTSVYKPIEDLCQKQCQKLKKHCISLASHFRDFAKKNPNQKIYRDKSKGGHLSATGHKVVAKVIYKYLLDKKLK